MTINAERTAGIPPGNVRESDAGARCQDCLFWYRCKLGGIDCELKER